MRTCKKCCVDKEDGDFPFVNKEKGYRSHKCEACFTLYRQAAHARAVATPEGRIEWRRKVREYRAKKESPIPKYGDNRYAVAAVQRSAKKYPERTKARTAVMHAIRAGTIVRVPCWCGNPNSEAHHPSYKEEDWLRVTFLCALHHREEHIRLRNEALLQSQKSCPTP